MEVIINKDIREYSEHMFFGLTMRQTGFAAAGIAVSVAIYFLAKPILGLEVTTWLCVFAVVPFAVMGFIRINGLSAEQYAWAYFRTNFIVPRKLPCRPESLYYEVMKDNIEERLGMFTEKELKKRRKKKGGVRDDKIHKKH